MKQQDLQQLLKDTEQSAIRAEAKQRAIDAAMLEFREAAQTESAPAVKKAPRFQGLQRLLRLTGEQKSRSKTMTMNSRLMFSGLFATACMLGLGVMVALLFDEQSFTPVPAIQDMETADLAAPRRMEEQNSAAVEELIITASPPKAPAPDPRESAEVRKELLSQEPLGIASANRAAEAAQRYANRAQPYALAPADKGVVQRQLAPQLDAITPPHYQETGRDRFETVQSNPVKRVSEEPVSTFSIDVDTASYSFVRRQLNHGILPQKDAVRVEEMLNYFDYNYPAPDSREQPFKLSVAVNDSPWRQGNKLVHIGIKGYQLTQAALPKSNLVFLLDVSGSMNSPDKLPLVKQSMNLLLNQLQPEDTIAIVVYAGAAGTVLEPTPVKEKQKILAALNKLRAGGSTAGAQGIQLAYQLAEDNYDKQAVNRIILATDGDFNVGITNREELQGFVERKREKGIFLSVLGFGQGNYHDHMMQVLAQNGNGVAAYIDTLSEAQKVLVDQATSTLFTIAKDVKIQVEFNPATVMEYRLLGYETRALNREDFNNDAVDAGDIGSGHTVTAIYEITPTGTDAGLIEEHRYTAAPREQRGKAGEYGFIKIRYKLPDAAKSNLISRKISARNTPENQETRFATAVAGFAQLLKGGQYTGEWRYDDAIALAQQHKGEDLYGYRTEFVQLIRKAKIAKDM